MIKSRKIITYLMSVFILFAFFVAFQSLLAWDGPPGNPPGHVGYTPVDDYSVMINEGDTAQQKTGLLTLTKSPVGLIVNTGRMGVGTALPGGTLGIDNANTFIDVDGSGNLRFTDTQTGAHTLTDLFASGNTFVNGGNIAGGNRIIGNNDAYNFGLETNNSIAVFIHSDGNVSIGTTTTNEKLFVNGGLKVGWIADACEASIAGTMRWNATSSIMESCNGTSWN